MGHDRRGGHRGAGGLGRGSHRLDRTGYRRHRGWLRFDYRRGRRHGHGGRRFGGSSGRTRLARRCRQGRRADGYGSRNGCSKARRRSRLGWLRGRLGGADWRRSLGGSRCLGQVGSRWLCFSSTGRGGRCGFRGGRGSRGGCRRTRGRLGTFGGRSRACHAGACCIRLGRRIRHRVAALSRTAARLGSKGLVRWGWLAGLVACRRGRTAL